MNRHHWGPNHKGVLVCRRLSDFYNPIFLLLLGAIHILRHAENGENLTPTLLVTQKTIDFNILNNGRHVSNNPSPRPPCVT